MPFFLHPNRSLSPFHHIISRATSPGLGKTAPHSVSDSYFSVLSDFTHTCQLTIRMPLEKRCSSFLTLFSAGELYEVASSGAWLSNIWAVPCYTKTFIKIFHSNKCHSCESSNLSTEHKLPTKSLVRFIFLHASTPRYQTTSFNNFYLFSIIWTKFYLMTSLSFLHHSDLLKTMSFLSIFYIFLSIFIFCKQSKKFGCSTLRHSHEAQNTTDYLARCCGFRDVRQFEQGLSGYSRVL